MRPRFAALASLTALLSLLGSTSALAADWYVDAAAAAGGDGSEAKPFQTINAALAGPCDRVAAGCSGGDLPARDGRFTRALPRTPAPTVP